MIQAPTSQYPQGIAPQVAQQPVQLAPAAAQPAAPQTVPAGYYNYPTSNFYQYPQAQATPAAQPSQANAVNIQIYNPQAYAGSPNQTAAPAPASTVPAQFVPVQQPTVAPAPATPVPVPPAPVITEETPVAPAPEAAPATPTAEATTPTPAAIETPATDAPKTPTAIDVPAFSARLKSDNLEDQGKAIEEIAELTQNDPTSAAALLDTQIMEGLLGVVAKDTASLQGPTPQQLELRQKAVSGQTLTDAEKTEANNITPMETAERNKQYALYTVAFLQNLLNSEVEKRNGSALDIQNVPGLEQVVQTVKSDANPLLRVSALASLSHIARPEYKPVLSQVFELAKTDADENVKKAAEKAAEELAKLPDAPAAAPVAAPVTAEAPVAPAPEAAPAETKKA